jgi:hypothetical protein
MVASHSYREVSASHRLQRLKQFLRRVRLAVRVRFDFAATAIGRSCGTEITHGIPSSKWGSNPSMCESIILHHKIAQMTLDQAKYLLKIKEITERFTEIQAPGTQPKRNNSRVQFWFQRAELIYLIVQVCRIPSHRMIATLLRPVDS